MRAGELRIDDLLQMDPRGGVIRFGGRRTLLLDAVALGLLRAQLIDVFGLTVARGLFTRLGYAHGWRTAEALRDSLPWDDEHEWRIAGGRLHRLQGLVTFEPVSAPDRRDPAALAEAIWKDSYEAEQHVLHMGRATEPVCWTLAGFASGYLSHVLGQAVYCIEEQCCGQGDSVCHMVGRTQEAWGEKIAPHLPFYERECLDESLRSLRATVRELESRLRAHRRMLGPDRDVLETGGIVARSSAMRRIIHLCQRAAKVDSTILVCGESGVGKERVAGYIHDQSERTGGPFVAVNCGALPETLLESELFGHVRGAFTGASSDRPGLFEAAHGGTLFLDEIGEVPPSIQVRLLRVLQEREVRRVGENRDRKVDVRVLAATNRPLMAEVEAGRFRQDLLYRLRVIEIEVPPLRDRPDDILPLARAKLVETASRFKRKVRDFTPAVARRLIAHSWPGNVRELHNAIERAVVFAESEHIEIGDLPDFALATASGGSDGESPGSARVAPAPGTLADVERAHILAMLQATGGNKAEAARRLGIGEATLYRKIRRYRAEGHEVS